MVNGGLCCGARSGRCMLPYKHLRVVTATGDATFDIVDNQRQPGAPGDLDGIAGQIALQVDAQPLFVEPK